MASVSGAVRHVLMQSLIMKSYLLAVSVACGAVALAVCVYLALRLYRKRSGGKDIEYKQFQNPPSIMLTTTSPLGHRKKLHSPGTQKRTSQEEENLAQLRKKKRLEVKSMWLPKRKESLPMLKATLVQPAVDQNGTEEKDRKGRLSFSLHYKYHHASKSSSFVVNLSKAENMLSDEGQPMDIFVKTQLLPSRKQVFVSRVHRQLANPEFQEQYEFDITYEELQTQRLLFLIKAFDCFSKHKTIGEVRVTLAELGTYGFNILREISLCMHISEPVSQ